jgi:hypothetical protein
MTATRGRAATAHDLAELSFAIHPLVAGTKAPATAHGHLDAARDTGWWERRPEDNIGIALEPSGLFVIGPDNPYWLAEFERRGLPDTLVVQTGSGAGHRHYFYRRPDDCPVHRRCRSGEYDLMTNGYVVAPGSTTSGPYVALTPLRAVHDLPFAPAWAVEMLTAHHDRRQAAPAAAKRPAMPLSLSDQETLDRARSAANGARFARLYGGDATAHNGDDRSHSGAELALLSMLAFWTQDEAQLDRLYLSSRLARPDHWRGSYRAHTLAKALNRSAFYEPDDGARIVRDDRHHAEPAPVVAPALPDGMTCEAALAAAQAELVMLRERVAALEAENRALRDRLRGVDELQSLTAQVRNNAGLTATEAAVATNVVNEVGAKLAAGEAEDGWVRVRLDAVTKARETVDPETGEILTVRAVSKQTASRAIDRLADTGIWERRNETRYPVSGSPITDMFIRLAAEPRETMRRLATVMPERPKHSGSRPGRVRRCPKHPEAGVDVSRVTRCAECGDILDEQHVEHVPAVRFQDGTVEHTTTVEDVTLGVNLGTVDHTGPFQDETADRNECGLCRRPLRNDAERAAGCHAYDCTAPLDEPPRPPPRPPSPAAPLWAAGGGD